MAKSSAPAPIEIDRLPYPVIIGAHLERRIADFVASRNDGRVIILCDANVLEHAKRIARALPGKPNILSFALGEKRKRLRTVEKVLDALAELGADRKTLLIGVGGGVAGDLFGFVASCYMRGVPFINVATSIVAMVDASIGGKTGVDLGAGKNLAGAFRDPQAVFAAIDTLATLPVRQIREGLGEVVKHAVIEGESIFARIEELALKPLSDWPWQELVAESMRIKAEVVTDDRFENGRRELLNLGHTFAHGFEYASNYRISHGAAVGMGLRAAGLLAQKIHGFSAIDHQRTLALLVRLRLPLYNETIEIDDVLAGMMSDKKARAGKLRFVLPRAIGAVDFGITAKPAQVRSVVKQILTVPSRRELGA